MSKWGLGHVSTLERRAMENVREIDIRKIYEQKNELFRNSDSTETSSLSSESDKYSSKKTK